jgi:hypothetical protein
MPIVKIAPVTRQGMKLLISLFGLSETGKTYSALKLAAGIEPDPMKRGLLDSEGGERGRAYADAIEGGFMYGALTAPFSPERYVEALMDFVEAGVTTLVIDSVSHAWFASGGILDMVENASEKNDMAKWAKPKRRLGKLTQQWNQCGLNLILCSRGKQPMIEEVIDGRKKYIPGPIIPIQEKSLRFDMTIMALMLGDGEFTVERQYGGKCPGALRPVFAANSKMDEAMGKRLIDWIGGADSLSPAQRGMMLQADDKAGEGIEAFRAWWKELAPSVRDFLKPSLPNYQSIAASSDAERARLTEGDDGLSDPFSGKAIPGGVQRLGEAA